MVIDGQSMLVKSEVAEAQMVVEAAELEEKVRASKPVSQAPALPISGTSEQPIAGPIVQKSLLRDGDAALLAPPTAEKKSQRFYGSVQINERMMASEAGRIMEEVVKHLTSLAGAKVKVTLEIAAELPQGTPDHVVRTVKENSHTLRFQTSEFHEE